MPQQRSRISRAAGHPLKTLASGRAPKEQIVSLGVDRAGGAAGPAEEAEAPAAAALEEIQEEAEETAMDSGDTADAMWKAAGDVF